MPGLPESFRIVEGVEKMLQVGRISTIAQRRLERPALPRADNLVHNERHGAKDTDGAFLEDMGLDDLERAAVILADFVVGGVTRDGLDDLSV